MYVCICEQVTDKQIKTAIETGISSMRELRRSLGVASQCGRCGQCAKKLLKQHACNSSNCHRKMTTQASSTDLMGDFARYGELTA